MASRTQRIGKYVIFAAGSAVSGFALYKLIDQKKERYLSVSASSSQQSPLKYVHAKSLPLRAEQLKSLQETKQFDILVIGGGATGCGVALDSVTRGLSTALVEMDDFGSGTSSRSTKLIHGGVRYLQKAIFNLDYEQYRMVKEALHERANLLAIAPHLSSPLPIMLPVYRWWKIPYYWAGIKMYDLIAGRKNVKSSYFLTKKSALELFPMLNKDQLVGALVYYDGQHNDARMNLAIALSAARYGAAVANHVAVTRLLKDENGLIAGAHVVDQLTGKEWDIHAKCVINATGPFTDSIRLMADPNTPKICQPSSGVHIVLPDYYSPESMGLLDPETKDGRVIFFLPWEKSTIAGTTDRQCEVTHSPSPTEADIQFILNEIRHYLDKDVIVRRGDVMSTWCGIRPLVLDPSKPNTESIARNHIVHVSPDGLVTIAGGKWTTYRVMAKEAVDAAIANNKSIEPKCDCRTDGLLLEGGDDWTPTMYIQLVQDYGLETHVAKHLAHIYGDKAFAVAKLADLTGKRWPVAGTRLHSEFPYIIAEVRFAVREFACTAVDVIARRLSIAFLNAKAAEETLPKVVDILAEELKWSSKEKQIQLEKALEFLRVEMGQNVHKELRDSIPISLTKDEINRFSKQFHSLDRDRKGYIGVNDLRRSMKASGTKMSDEELRSMLSEVDINMNGQVELGEYLELMCALKTGNISQSRFSKAVEIEFTKEKISVERSGGGL